MRRVSGAEPDFFGLLLRHVEKIDEGVRTFHRFLETEASEDARRVRQLEKEADQLRRELRGKLFDSFATPIDREDLYYLSRRLDEVINYVKHALRDIQILEIHAPPDILAMSKCLVDGTGHLLEAIRNLPRDATACSHHARAAKNFENDLTKLYPRTLRRVFELDDVKEILKQRELLSQLSRISDRMDEAADVVLHIVIKES
jgi:predicted phosphate transport protein (TIGR00153 family)